MAMSEIQSELAQLRERLQRLERLRTKSGRGRVNQRRAAEYLGRSREFLRQLALRGEGPRRGADGLYSLDDLDSWAEPTAP
jgi:hypothetical protein